MKHHLVENAEGLGYLDQDDCSWDDPLDWFWCGVLGGCGCGNSDSIAETAFKVLELFSLSGDNWDERSFSVYDKPEYEILAHWIDSKGLIEHGSSIGGSWLSKEGLEIYSNIKKLM